MSAEMPPIEIRPDHWKIVQRILQEHVPDLEVWAFGSRAKWSAKEFSDLDLAIITDEPLPLDTSAALSEAFSESDLPWKVDVVDWASVGDELKKVITRDKVVLKNGDDLVKGKGWKECFLGDVVELKRGYDLPHKKRLRGNVPLISSSGITDFHSIPMVKGPGVVTGRYGTLGQVFFVDEDFWPLNTTLYVRDFKGNDPRFVAYFLRSIDFLSYSDKAAVPGINRNHLHRAPIKIPTSLEEQRAIARILGTLDDKIELNRKQNETLEEMARALFKAWFVDFEPVRAKMEGRWKRGQSLPGMPAHLYDLFPDRMVESELGEIPEGWKMRTLADYATLNPESWSKVTRPSAIRYVDLFGTKWGRIESITDYASSEAPSRAQRVLRPLDTLVGTVRPGNGSYTLIGEEGLTGSTGFAVLRPLNRINAEFVYLAATAAENIERLSSLADGGAYPAVRPEVVLATPVPIINPPLINVFSRQISPMLEEVSENESESRVLAQLRDTLLPKLVSGALLVSVTKE